jgi:hypothetical protein
MHPKDRFAQLTALVQRELPSLGECAAPARRPSKAGWSASEVLKALQEGRKKEDEARRKRRGRILAMMACAWRERAYVGFLERRLPAFRCGDQTVRVVTIVQADGARLVAAHGARLLLALGARDLQKSIVVLERRLRRPTGEVRANPGSSHRGLPCERITPESIRVRSDFCNGYPVEKANSGPGSRPPPSTRQSRPTRR